MDGGVGKVCQEEVEEAQTLGDARRVVLVLGKAVDKVKEQGERAKPSTKAQIRGGKHG